MGIRFRAANPQERLQQWLDTLENAARSAIDIGDLSTGSDPRQLAFELEAILLSANWYFHLYSDATYIDRARRAIRARLASEATRTGLRALVPAENVVRTGQAAATVVGEGGTCGPRRSTQPGRCSRE